MNDVSGERRSEPSIAQHQEIEKSKGPSLIHKDYTIGWICALRTEQTAARAMLDAEYDGLPTPPHDHNAYTLGRIGRHNVVIACLPKGQLATIPAAKAATWMMGTFPSIRFGLMVGIGAGMPTKVSLGDIVVSAPSASYPGVVQWDLGKAEDGGHFLRTGALNNPPTILLTAALRLESQHELKGSSICQYLEEAVNRYPRLKSKYKIPKRFEKAQTGSTESGPKHDQWLRVLVAFWLMLCFAFSTMLGFSLLQAAGDKQKLTSVPAAVIDTNESSEDRQSWEPHVHYGLIASGNEVVKDANVRDRIEGGLGGNLLCIEMEAAGLMNDFPCIVIRGICDYADARKEKSWQDYAAAMAAGYAKELLVTIDPSDVKQEPEAAKLLMQTLQKVASDTKTIAQKQEQQIQTEEQRTQEAKWQKLSGWLSPIVQSAKHTENQKQRVRNTGSWLLRHPVFRDWVSLKTPNRALYCYGDPGAGKTIIASIVIDELERYAGKGSKIGVGYVYCDYRNQQAHTAANVFGEILRQLLRRLVAVPPPVWQSYDTYCKEQEAGAQIALDPPEALRLVDIVCAQFDVVYVCLDALDEVANLAHILELLRVCSSNMQLFLTGRPHVQTTVQNYLTGARLFPIIAHESDLVRYVDREIGGPDDAEPEAMNDELRIEIQRRICESAKGIFLLPVLQVRAVLQNLTIRERETSLKTIPSTIGEAFAGSFVRIQRQPGPQADRAAEIIAWVYLAQRPFTVGELLYLLSIRVGDTSFDPKGVPVKKTFFTCCHGLITVDQDTSIVRLVHFSLQEYLRGQKEIFGRSITNWHRHIAIICLTLAKLPNLTESAEPRGIRAEWQEPVSRSILRYAAQNWGHHLRHDEATPESVYTMITEYYSTHFEKDYTSVFALQDCMGLNRKVLPSSMSVSHVAAYFGLSEYLLHLVDVGVSFDLQDHEGRTPLIVAAKFGHIEVVRLLLAGPDTRINAKDKNGVTSLHHAARAGHGELVKLLLSHPEVEVDGSDDEGETPLGFAVLMGHASIVQQLLARSEVDVNSQQFDGRTPLSNAICEGHYEVVKLLLRREDLDVNRSDDFGMTPLLFAALHGQIEAAGLLLAHPSILINSKNDLGGTALSTLLEEHVPRRGRRIRRTKLGIDIEFLQLLLSQPRLRIALNTRHEYGRTPLIMAAMRGSVEAVRLLLAQPSIGKDMQDDFGDTSLSIAIQHVHFEVVKVLLAQPRISVASLNEDGHTPLSIAVLDGWTEGVKLLLANPSVGVNTRNKFGLTPLHLARDGEIVKLLLAHPDIDANARDPMGVTPLSAMITHGFSEGVKLLLAYPGIDVNARDEYNRTALWRAAEQSDHETIRLLVQHDATIDSDEEILGSDMEDASGEI